MKIIDLLNKIANGEEVPKKIKIKDEIFKKDNEHNTYILENGIANLFNKTYWLDFHKNYYNDFDFYNDEVEITEEDKLKNKITVVDKEGNEKEYLLELGEGLKENEKIFKADNGKWYVQKLIDEKSEFYKWLDEFKPTIYYSIEEDKKIEKLRQLCEYPSTDTYECWSIKEDILVDKINEIIDVINKE